MTVFAEGVKLHLYHPIFFSYTVYLHLPNSHESTAWEPLRELSRWRGEGNTALKNTKEPLFKQGFRNRFESKFKEWEWWSMGPQKQENSLSRPCSLALLGQTTGHCPSLSGCHYREGPLPGCKEIHLS
jgi:hypothetical protein